MSARSRALASVQATMGIEPTAPPADVEMEDGATESSGALPADVDAQIGETHKTYV